MIFHRSKSFATVSRCALLVALNAAVLSTRASLNQSLVKAAQLIDRVRTADLLFFRTGQPWKPIFEQCEHHFRERLWMGMFLCHTFLRGRLAEREGERRKERHGMENPAGSDCTGYIVAMEFGY
jgi:hypothetical protein